MKNMLQMSADTLEKEWLAVACPTGIEPVTLSLEG
jgi:hypothetical protein